MATHISSNTPTDRHTTNTILSTFFLVTKTHRFIHNNVLTPGGFCVQNETGGGTQNASEKATRSQKKRKTGLLVVGKI